MRSAYCQALVETPERSFFVADMVRGTEHYQRAESAGRVGALIATPGFLKRQIEKLDAEWEAMREEVSKQFVALVRLKGLSEANQMPEGRWLAEVWTPMIGRWRAFKEGHSQWYYNLWGGIWDAVKMHRNTLVSLRDKAERAGYKFVSPAPLPPEPSPWDSISFILKAVVGAVIGSAALYLVGMIIQAFRG